MKKALILVAILLMLAPASAMAGMTAFMNMDEMSGNEMSDVTGQTGISIDSTVKFNGGYVAWGDLDGAAGIAATAGYLILNSIYTPTALTMTGLTLDACTDGATTYLVIGLPAITGSATMQLLLGNDANPNVATNEASLGELTLGSLSFGTSTIKIYGH